MKITFKEYCEILEDLGFKRSSDVKTAMRSGGSTISTFRKGKLLFFCPTYKQSQIVREVHVVAAEAHVNKVSRLKTKYASVGEFKMGEYLLRKRLAEIQKLHKKSVRALKKTVDELQSERRLRISKASSGIRYVSRDETEFHEAWGPK